MVFAVSLGVSLTSIYFFCTPPFFQSKCWIMIGNIFAAPWLLPSVETPQYWIYLSASSATSTEWGAITPFTMTSVLVRALLNFLAVSESGNVVFNKTLVQSIDL